MNTTPAPPQAPPPIATIEELLDRSRATAEFRAAALKFADSFSASERVVFARGCPPVKVLRALMGLLEFHPGLEIDRVHVRGSSGCSDFTGEISVEPTGANFRFVWDCSWRATQLGWSDFMGFADQGRAAREWGYRCFEVWEQV